ncbi:MAG: OmpA family protein [Brevinematia bacterium]
MKKNFFYIILIFSIFNKLYSLPEAAEFLYLPAVLSSSSKAYAGSCNTEASANFLINPALASGNGFFSFFLNYGFITDFPYFQGGISIPISDIKLSVATKIMGNRNSATYRNVGSLYSGVFGISKRVANNFLVGANFNFSYLLTENFSDISYTFDTGLLYGFMNIYENSGFCFKNTLFGLTFYGIGKQAVYEDRSGIPPLGSRLGTKTTFFDTKNFDADIGFEVNYNILLKEFFFSTFLDFKILKDFGISAGYTIGNKNIGNFERGIYPFSFGFSYTRKIAEIPLSLFYSFNSFNFNERNFIHFIGVEISIPDFGTNTSVILRMGEEKTNYYSFSPNFDREKDTLPFYINVKTEHPVEHWELIISDTNDIVKKFRDREDEEHNIIKLFAKIFEKKESIPVPERIEWDGLSDNGSVLNEGEYIAYFCLISDKKTNFSETNYIKLDVTPPSGSISLDDIYFSPNNDGFKDKLNIYPSLSKDEWSMKIINKSEVLVFSTNFGFEVPTSFSWDGKDNKGNVLPSGLYDILFLGKDDANNKSILYVNDVFLSMQKYAAYLSFKKEASFNIDREINIKPFVVPDDLRLSYWKLSIYNDRNTLINLIEGNELPQAIKWNGKDRKSIIVPDGEYFLKLEVVFVNGERASSPVYKLYVDSNPPLPSIKLKNIPFSPDDDGINDNLELDVYLSDRSEVKSFRLNILDPDRRLFKTFSFRNTNRAKINWDGRSDDGEHVESAQNYDCEVEAIDKLGNKTNIIAGSIPTDVLVEKIDRGYKIKINNIEFEFGKHEILPKSVPVLKRVAEILKKFNEYEIEIHGHTDNIGNANYNLNLSRKRAESVYYFLIKEGIPARQMKTAGFGFKYPIADNSTEEGRRKNRRVEFILKK